MLEPVHPTSHKRLGKENLAGAECRGEFIFRSGASRKRNADNSVRRTYQPAQKSASTDQSTGPHRGARATSSLVLGIGTRRGSVLCRVPQHDRRPSMVHLWRPGRPRPTQGSPASIDDAGFAVARGQLSDGRAGSDGRRGSRHRGEGRRFARPGARRNQWIVLRSGRRGQYSFHHPTIDRQSHLAGAVGGAGEAAGNEPISSRSHRPSALEYLSGAIDHRLINFSQTNSYLRPTPQLDRRRRQRWSIAIKLLKHLDILLVAVAWKIPALNTKPFARPLAIRQQQW